MDMLATLAKALKEKHRQVIRDQHLTVKRSQKEANDKSRASTGNDPLGNYLLRPPSLRCSIVICCNLSRGESYM